jgi:Zn-finger nucleic acid-binding protein
VKCPACSNEMTQVEVQDVSFDVCQGGCGGIWFDWFELNRIDEPHEALGADVFHTDVDNANAPDPDAKRHCPRCENMPMMRHFHSVRREVHVDECPRCAGFFLDHGELNQIRSQFSTDDERSAEAQRVFADLFDEGLDQMAEESDETAQKSRRLANMFKFLLPSNYLPGKQKWGAF